MFKRETKTLLQKINRVVRQTGIRKMNRAIRQIDRAILQINRAISTIKRDIRHINANFNIFGTQVRSIEHIILY